MKKLIFCLVLLLVSTPLFAGVMGLGVGVHGGIDMMISSEEDAETQNFTAIGGALDFSLPGIPIGLRGDFDYAWKSIAGNTATAKIILLAGQYNVVLPGAPMSFYLGAGGQMAMGDDGAGNTSTDFGFLGYAGANYNMGMMGLFAEVGYGMIFTDPSTTNIPIRGGIKFSL